MRILRYLASTRLTLIGMAMLGIGAALSYDNPVHTPVWVLVVPLALLALNLLLAILTNSRINRRGGLLVFHVGLLGIVILAAIGRLTFLEAHLEIIDGDHFAPEDLIDVRSGLWHSGNLGKISFVQGIYTVNYSPGMIRGLTHSHVQVQDDSGGWQHRIVGDDRPLVIENYRFYTTFNKGFSPVLTWIPERGVPMTGAVNMPSYPLFEFKQANTWTPPGSEEIKFWLQLEAGLDETAHWTLDAERATGVLVVNTGDKRVELRPGDSVQLMGGRLRYERLASWMGYKVFYDPTLQWLFFVAIMGVMGMSTHLWRKLSVQTLPAAVSNKNPVFPKGTEGTA